MNTKIAMITAGILAAGLMVVASYTSSVWATAMISSGSSSSESTTSAAGGAGTSLGDSSSVGGSTGGAAGFIAICGDTVKILGACSSEDP
jgi:hypothetical protein